MIAAARFAVSCPRRAAPLAAVLLVALLLAAPVGPTGASLPPTHAIPARTATPHSAQVLDLARRIDVNRLNMFTTNVGSFAWDIGGPGSPPGLIWPRGTNQTAVFAAGLWLGCRVGSETRVVVSEYSFEYGPGGMVGGTFDDPNRPEHRVYKVARWTGNPADSAHVDRTPAELAADPMLDPLAHHAWSEYIAGAKPYGAPTRMHRLPDTSTPQPDDSVDVEGPDVLGDQMLWEVHNDADPSRHTNDAGNSTPLGVEIQQTTFAFDRPDDFGNIVFFRFRIFNKGGNTLDDLHVSIWSDPDLGGAADDLVGCDTTRALGFCYNATGNDLIYGASPPAVGFALLRGPLAVGTGIPLGLTSFNKYIGGTDPASPVESFNYMQGLQWDGSDVIDPTTGLMTRYSVPGDPVTGQGWLDINPADRRLMLNSGPSRMLPGESQEVWAALLVGRGLNRLSSISAVRCLADLAHGALASGFTSLPTTTVACSSVSNPGNCPGSAAFWSRECDGAGSGLLSAQQLAQAAAFVNAQSCLFDWTADPLGQLCATIDPPGPFDLRKRARSEFAAFLANYAGSQLDFSIGGGARVFLNPVSSIACPPLAATTIAELAETAQLTPQLLDAVYLNNNTTNRRALEGVNFGLAAFNGGADVAFNFFGSTLHPSTMPDSFTTVQVRFDRTATQKAYRFVRMQTASGASPAAYPDRGYLNRGFLEVPFQVWDATNNIQLDAAFVERELTDDAGVRQTVGQVASSDSTWGPTAEADGGREYIFIYRRPYSDTPKAELAVDGSVLAGTVPVLYTVLPKLRTQTDIIDDGDVLEFRWDRPPSRGVDLLLWDLEGQPLSDPAVQTAYQEIGDCLEQINAGIGIESPCLSGTTPTLVSLVSAEAVPGRVTLRWYCADPGLSASVERLVAAEDWTAIGRVASDGAGILLFEDMDVIPGEAYDYRLAIRIGDQVEYIGHASVEVPSGAVLAFRSARLDPSDGRLHLGFSLATREPARIEVLDVAGRRLFARDVAGLAPGSHALTLEASLHLPAGIYLVRITQGARRVSGKTAIVR